MTLFKKKKEIPEGRYRIIKISKKALFEFICESMIDHQECFFDVTDGTKIFTRFEMNWETGELICIARNAKSENEDLEFTFDTGELMSKLQDTTDTLYADHRYIELSEDEIRNISL